MFGFFGHLSKRKGLSQSAAVQAVAQNIVFKDLALLPAYPGIACFHQGQRLLHISALAKAQSRYQQGHGPVTAYGSARIVKHRDPPAAESPQYRGNVSFFIRDQHSHIPVTISVSGHRQYPVSQQGCFQLSVGAGTQMHLLRLLQKRPGRIRKQLRFHMC